jgi:hypothetical protein
MVNHLFIASLANSLSDPFPYTKKLRLIEALLGHERSRRLFLVCAGVFTYEADSELSDMIHSALIILIGILPFFDMPLARESAPLLTIDFSLDSKDDREFGHTVIQYSLTEGGREFDARNVHGWAHQTDRRRALSKGVVARITELARELPNSKEENIPKDWIATVTFRDGNKVRMNNYHRKRLPHAVKEILELLGGIRFELRDTIAFSATGR